MCDHSLTLAQTEVKKSRILRCQECGLAVARPSHLARHLQSHLPPARREHFPCTECGRQFSRNDVLLRHLRTAHQSYTSRKRCAQKSCFRCVKKKLKCDRGQPCLPCAKSATSCEYAVDVSPEDTEAEAPREKKTGAKNSDNHQVKEQALCENNGYKVSNSYQDDATSDPPVVQANHVYIPNHTRSSAGAQGYPETAHYFQSPSDGNGPGIMATDVASYPALSPTEGTAAFTQPYMAFENAYLPAEFNFFPSNSAPRIAGMAEGGLDWLGLELDSPNDGDVRAQTMGQIYSPGSIQYIPNQAMMLGDSEALFGRFQSLNGAGMPQSRPKDSMSTANTPRAGTQQWPFDHTGNPEPQKHKLPPLRDILQGTISASDNGNTIRSLVQLLSTSYLPDVESADMSMMTAMDVLKTSLDLYFTEFHAVLPLGGSDSTNFYKPAYLIACCLHQIYSLGSGNRRLYQNADCNRGTLVGCLRGMGILKSRVSTEVENEDTRDVLTVDNATIEWLRWKDQEEEKRIAWSVFEYDCSLCTLTSRRGAIDLPELPSHLPCAEPLWDAPSAQAWSALYSRLSFTARGAPTSRILRNLLAGKALPTDLPAWSKRLCGQYIGRLLWDLKQLDIMATNEYLKLPSMSAAQQHTKSTLLHGLNTICESMYSPATTAELIHYNLASLICHYSHLYSADEAMDLIVHIFRTSASPTKSPDPSAMSARRRLGAILAKNPQKARNLAWHAAQIIAVANEYLVSAPCEILRVFMGYIFILAFAKFGPQPSSNSNFDSSPVRLDLSNRIADQRTAIAAWIQHGGFASIGLVKNIYSNGGLNAISQEAQTMLRQLRYWGLAKKFIWILESFDLMD
ncbi:hypothetical protein PV08_06128 [Exophiala spinifera]|uniref:Zn(2)-C6 fungal-type domain-containing protein n=1 Tax=Exophiala spinifera TaxID=91928 RepID=A0A0D1ZTH7_9EURO|nr:uncharacterized protein PV08_06128 [Exophiala spinifera]KIW16077.1 hypothetical protein PV08_06128 [Exophiala spinifera]